MINKKPMFNYRLHMQNEQYNVLELLEYMLDCIFQEKYFTYVTMWLCHSPSQSMYLLFTNATWGPAQLYNALALI